MRKWLWFNSLALVVLGCFVVFVVLQALFGWQVRNEELEQSGRVADSLLHYLSTGHFGEAVFENWESEFLQMGSYVLLTAYLVQRGSPESEPLEGNDRADDYPRNAGTGSPSLSRRPGVGQMLYRNSLALALLSMFALSFDATAPRSSPRLTDVFGVDFAPTVASAFAVENGGNAENPGISREGDAVDGIVLLKEDHKAVKRLFREFEKTHKAASPAAKRALVDKMITELTTHAFIEETIFYPAARAEVPETVDHVLESVEEHHVVAWLLSELAKLDVSDETFDAKVTVLIENVEHHADEEEQEWFPEVRKALGRNRLQALGERMAAAKPKAPADPLALMSAKA